jgi:exodeoxyribonuclease VII small subunit
MIWTVHIFPLVRAKGTTTGSKSGKIRGGLGPCPRPDHFSHRFFKSDRLLGFGYDFRLLFLQYRKDFLWLNFMAKVSAVAPKNFEAAMAELDLLVEKMESGQLPLEESLSAYQRGAELIKYCEKVLSDAQQRIQVLDGGSLKDFQQDSES